MCISALRFLKFEFPDEDLILKKLIVSGNEVLIRLNDKNSYLPVFSERNSELIKWGTKVAKLKKNMFFARIESLNAGRWNGFSPKLVEIRVSFALCRGVWFSVRQGISGILIENFNGDNVVFVLTKPSTHYFEVMTGSKRMPVLINQIL